MLIRNRSPRSSSLTGVRCYGHATLVPSGSQSGDRDIYGRGSKPRIRLKTSSMPGSRDSHSTSPRSKAQINSPKPRDHHTIWAKLSALLELSSGAVSSYQSCTVLESGMFMLFPHHWGRWRLWHDRRPPSVRDLGCSAMKYVHCWRPFDIRAMKGNAREKGLLAIRNTTATPQSSAQPGELLGS